MLSVLAVGAPPLVADLAIVIAATAILGFFCQRIGLVAIVGYLVAGVIIGPHAAGFIDDIDLVEQMGEIGVIFLMFFIGLELSGDLLKKLGSLMFGGGAIQVVLTIVIVAGVAVAFGVDLNTSIYTGALVALSSTAVVLKLVSKRRKTDSPTGQVSLAFLIFQDIAIVILVLLVPMLGEGGGGLGDILVESVTALLLIAAVLVAVKWIVPPILNAVSKRTDDEGFLLAILAIAGGVAYGVTLLGLTVSLGAFIAGLVVAAGPYRERAARFVEPFQAVFAAVFFASIGMLLDPSFLADSWAIVLFFCVVVVGIKVIGVGVAVAVFKRPLPVIAASAFLLAQIGEFSFILEKIGRDAGLTPGGREDGSQIFIAVAVLLIALTPLLYKIGTTAQERLERSSVD